MRTYHCLKVNNKRYIAPNKRGYPNIIFLISPRKCMLWHSLEVPQWGSAKHMFLWSNKDTSTLLLTKKHLTWSSVRYIIGNLPRPQGYKTFSSSIQLSMKFSLLINVKMSTILGIFIFISKRNFHAQLGLARKNLQLLVIWDILAGQISVQLSMKKFYNLWGYKTFCMLNSAEHEICFFFRLFVFL